MSDDRDTTTRRAVLGVLAAAAGTHAITTLAESAESTTYTGGSMLQQAYQVAGDLYIGPDSAKSNVSADSGRVFVAADTGLEYYGDSGSWEIREVASDIFDLKDASADPSANGEVQRNAGDVKVYSGGAVQNLSNVGSGGSGLSSVTSGTVTATGGAGVPGPAVDTTLTSVSTNQTLQYLVTVYVSSDPTWSADYAWNYEAGHQWDDSAGDLDIDLTVNWDTDPGNGNDLTLAWEVLQP